MSSTFTPSSAIDWEKERDWAANLGMLDWDNTQIVFSKRTLLEFLKYAGVTVDPNFTNIQKLPRYARFGTLSGDSATLPEVLPEVRAKQDAIATASQTENGYRPSRRVRAAPGGGHTNIFGNDNDDALTSAPPRPGETSVSPVASPEVAADASPKATPDEAAAESRPRAKRNASSGISGLWDEPDPQAFKPTRRVREMPGGKDSISSLF
ncbi:hypothetical protein DAEQUDRAFT_729979 [Daedalea quercina L-15889]|uniref:Uncharacterized protein n=1 Tax=Daedalea quercina L-15889 TaxID=1314783 RepID=A0A165N9X5_9APHY|nr:hypothetical protein DAEQUDRAFT_729979 [Daedalea quercina L-15889]